MRKGGREEEMKDEHEEGIMGRLEMCVYVVYV
jgi:hypothetical protein